MKVVLLCDRYLSDFDQAVIRDMQSSSGVQLAGVLINTKPAPGLMQRVKREWKKGRGGYVLVQILNGIVKRLNPSAPVETAAFLKNIPCKLTPTLYQTEVYDWIRQHSPDCLLLRGFGMIKEPILSMAPFGVLSFHHGNMYAYRGGPPAFWELYNNEAEVGVTLQVLDEGLDTGTVLSQRFFPVQRNGWSSMRKKIYEGSVTMVSEALQSLKQQEFRKKPIGPVGKLYTLPNLTQWVTLQFKILKRKMLK
jgi:folate-dependent phosphoribosylglycinamide formyltransferase PurN